MSESDPRVQNALLLEHLAAGIEMLEGRVLDETDRDTAWELACRLDCIALRRTLEPPHA